jgi:CelD/BcsL family acetyltransferase involved in cellulose biosynthesis
LYSSVHAADFDGIENEWVDFLPHAAANTVFVTPWWQRTWWENFGDGWDLQITSFRSEGNTIGIAPLMLKDGELRLVGDPDIVDYLDFLVLEDRASEFFGKLWEYVNGLEWRRAVFTGVSEGSPTLGEFVSLARAGGCQVTIEKEDTTPLTDLPASWDDYLLGLTKKNRHELRRKIRRLERAGEFCQYVRSDPSTLDEDMEDFFRLLKASRSDKDEFLTPERRKFFLDTAVELVGRHQFKLNFLELHGERVACCISFDYDGQYLLYNSGYNPEYSSLSVGLINKALCIKDAINEGRHRFDFLRGSERYKYDLGGVDRLVYRVTVDR